MQLNQDVAQLVEAFESIQLDKMEIADLKRKVMNAENNLKCEIVRQGRTELLSINRNAIIQLTRRNR